MSLGLNYTLIKPQPTPGNQKPKNVGSPVQHKKYSYKKCDKSVPHSDNWSVCQTGAISEYVLDKSSPLLHHHFHCKGRHMLRLHGRLFVFSYIPVLKTGFKFCKPYICKYCQSNVEGCGEPSRGVPCIGARDRFTDDNPSGR